MKDGWGVDVPTLISLRWLPRSVNIQWAESRLSSRFAVVHREGNSHDRPLLGWYGCRFVYNSGLLYSSARCLKDKVHIFKRGEKHLPQSVNVQSNFTKFLFCEIEFQSEVQGYGDTIDLLRNCTKGFMKICRNTAMNITWIPTLFVLDKSRLLLL